jgi:hypothetical protein
VSRVSIAGYRMKEGQRVRKLRHKSREIDSNWTKEFYGSSEVTTITARGTLTRNTATANSSNFDRQ